MSKKVLVLSIPRLEPHRPPISSTIVATVCKNHGCDVTLRDLNIEFYHYCKNINLDYHKFDSVWDKFTEPTEQDLYHITTSINNFIKSVNLPKFDYVMLSVFGVSNHLYAEMLLKAIATPNRNYRILVGGAGAFVSIKNRSREPFVTEMKNAGLVDDFIKGECEEALKYYLDGKEYPGVNNYDPVQIEDLDSLPLIDYSFVDLNAYNYIDNTRDVYVEGSRGCVRKCTYCDVAAYWPKYRFRSGEHIARELINNYEKYGVKKFYFTDSLVNGSLKSFSQMCEILSNYQYNKEISWGGQFIFRNQKAVPPEHFEMIAAAGGLNTFYVGVETGSDRIRREMGKNFSNDDIEYQLEQFKKNKLKCTFLMFPGYVTETHQDHQDTLDMFPRWQKYVASGTINGLELGAPLIVLERTPLSRMIDEYQIEFLDSDKIVTNHYWQAKINPGFDFEQRVLRQLELYEEAAKYKWPIWRFSARAGDLKQALLNFYKIKKQDSTYKVIPIRS